MVKPLVTRVAVHSGVDASTVEKVLESLPEVAKEALLSTDEFLWPGMVKMRLVRAPATAERQGINPFTKERIVLQARPATVKVRVVAAAELTRALGGGDEAEDRHDPIRE